MKKLDNDNVLLNFTEETGTNNFIMNLFDESKTSLVNALGDLDFIINRIAVGIKAIFMIWNISKV